MVKTKDGEIRMLKELAYYDGVWGAPEEIQIPFFDRSHFFGDGVYEATPGVNGKIFLLEDHLDRFYSSANELEIRIPMKKKELGELLTKLLAEVEGNNHSVYWQVTRGVDDGRSHAHRHGDDCRLHLHFHPTDLQDMLSLHHPHRRKLRRIPSRQHHPGRYAHPYQCRRRSVLPHPVLPECLPAHHVRSHWSASPLWHIPCHLQYRKF